MSALVAWSFLFPLPFLVLNALGVPKKAGALSWLGPLGIFLSSVGFLLGDRAPAEVAIAGWAPFLPDASFRLLVDGLSASMLAVVGGVATCVFIYAIAYMHEDERPHRFFAMLDFFVAAMTLLVLAGNLGVLLVGWTGVGIASFLLISFWWQKGWPLQAGFLALGANAIGDAALLVAAVLVPTGGGALSSLHSVARDSIGGPTLIGALIVVAACAKSAQGPLWFWLPSAMAGPTPVSALIHAATMVAAGVYLLVRTHTLLEMSPMVMQTIVLVGLSTALLGGLASLWQTNFKRGIAYSTASQLGWMFVAVGIGAPFAAFFHLVTHASFKALLFLGAGTIIHTCHHEEDIRKVGGLAKKLPLTHLLFLVGTLALIGTPLFSGSYSKDLILEAAEHSTSMHWVFYALLVGVVITGAYAGRLYFGLFHGEEGEASKHAHGAGIGLDGPLLPLAAGAVGLGFLQAQTHGLGSLLGGVAGEAEEVSWMPTQLGLVAFALALVGVGIGYVLSRTENKGLPALPDALVDGIVGEVKALPDGVASIHGGRIGPYLAMTLVGAALVLGASLRPASNAPARESSSSSRPALGASERGRPGAATTRIQEMIKSGRLRRVNSDANGAGPQPAALDVKRAPVQVEGGAQ